MAAPQIISVRMPRRGGGQRERLATVLARYPALGQIRVQFCDDGQRALIVPQSIAWAATEPEAQHA
jgi:hypothetical protein